MSVCVCVAMVEEDSKLTVDCQHGFVSMEA